MKVSVAKILIVAAMALVGARAEARTASQLFATAPDNVIRLLPQSTRLDMLDYFNYGSTRASANAFDGEARMTAVSDAAVSFELDKGVEMQIAVLPAAKDTVVALVTTLHMPVPDSYIEFYDTAWRPLRKAPMTLPAYDAWLTPEGLAARTDVELQLPFMPVSATFDRDARVLKLTNEAPMYLEDKKADEMADKLVGSMVYDVAGGKFTLRK